MRKYFEKHPQYSYDPETGEIFGIDGRVLKQLVNRQGYLQVNFHENGKQKTYRVNRLICEAEHPNLENLETVDHIDGNKLNNSAENLRWLSRSENARLGNLGNKNRLGTHPSAETRQKISNALKGKKRKPFSEETKRKIGEANKGNKTWLGKHHSEETKKKISDARKKYWATKNSEKESDA